MQIVVTLVAPAGRSLSRDAVTAASRAIGSDTDPAWLEPGEACDIVVEGDALDGGDIRAALAPQMRRQGLDWSVQPVGGRRKRLLVSDMDSTIIGQECIDEIADFAGQREDVARITARAMAGELDFEDALKARVSLLEGLASETLDRVFTERVTVNPGAAILVATMRAHGARTVLVSGGFTFFARRVADKVGFDAFQANELIIEEGRLAGRVKEPILGRDAKHGLLVGECARLGIDTAAAAALGDGANDLALIEAAGLGIAYRAKPVLAVSADALIDHGDLTAALFFQGYRRREFATA